MISRQNGSTITIALVLLFSITQVSLVRGFARDNTPGGTAAQQPAIGILSTQGNQPITVNGISTNAGATILTGATIETPAGVGASINFGPLGSLSIDPNTKITVDFASGSIKVMLLQGCITLRTKQGTRGEVDTEKGVAGTSEAAKDGVIPFCAPGAVATLPAAAAGGPWLGAKVLVPMFAGSAAVLAALAARSDNPSPTTP